jgi:hypothetical protein
LPLLRKLGTTVKSYELKSKNVDTDTSLRDDADDDNDDDDKNDDDHGNEDKDEVHDNDDLIICYYIIYVSGHW